MKRGWVTTNLRCSFCNKPQDKVDKLIGTPKGLTPAYICDACIAACNSILEQHSGPSNRPNARYHVGKSEGLHKESWFDRMKSWWKYGIIEPAVFKHNQ